MKKINKIGQIIPKQYVGNETGAQAEINAGDAVGARHKFLEAKQRLLDINHWHVYSGTKATIFQLTNAQGHPIDRTPEVGDYIRIDLPGPGSKAGQGYDWVRIEQFEDKSDKQADIDFFGFRVRPASNPINVDNTDLAHFYNEQTTSTFFVQRDGSNIMACEKGRNEVPKVKTDQVLDNIRNTMVATAATLGLSIPQWKILMEGILNFK